MKLTPKSTTLCRALKREIKFEKNTHSNNITRN